MPGPDPHRLWIEEGENCAETIETTLVAFSPRVPAMAARAMAKALKGTPMQVAARAWAEGRC